jgi:hypothetical protein
MRTITKRGFLMSKVIGYKIMSLEDNKICSLASNTYKFSANKDSIMKMGGDGIWVSTNKDFVIENYLGNTDKQEVLVTVEFDSKDMTRGNLEDREPVITIPVVKIIDVQLAVDCEVKESIFNVESSQEIPDFLNAKGVAKKINNSTVSDDFKLKVSDEKKKQGYKGFKS